MSWLEIVFQILLNMPTLISDIEKLLASLHTLPLAQQNAARAQIATAISSGNTESVKTALSGILPSGGN